MRGKISTHYLEEAVAPISQEFLSSSDSDVTRNILIKSGADSEVLGQLVREAPTAKSQVILEYDSPITPVDNRRMFLKHLCFNVLCMQVSYLIPREKLSKEGLVGVRVVVKENKQPMQI